MKFSVVFVSEYFCGISEWSFLKYFWVKNEHSEWYVLQYFWVKYKHSEWNMKFLSSEVSIVLCDLVEVQCWDVTLFKVTTSFSSLPFVFMWCYKFKFIMFLINNWIECRCILDNCENLAVNTLSNCALFCYCIG